MQNHIEYLRRQKAKVSLYWLVVTVLLTSWCLMIEGTVFAYYGHNLQETMYLYLSLRV